MIIHLNGMPGTGKLTIAELVSEALKAQLVDNHAIINAVYSSGYRHGSEGYQRVLREITAVVYDALVRNVDVKVVVMTNALANELETDRQRYADVQRLAEARGDAFVPIELFCAESENLRRVVMPARKEKWKLTDPVQLAAIRRTYTIIHPVDAPLGMRFDVSDKSAAESAEAIVAHVTHVDPTVESNAARTAPNPGTSTT